MTIEEHTHQTFADFDDEVRAADVAALYELGAGPISGPGLRDWIGDSASRWNLLGGAAFCTIRWSKSLGTPRTPTFSGAFNVLHESWRILIYGDPAHPHGVWDWRPVDASPLVFPGSADGDDYTVSVIFFPDLSRRNRVTVSLVPGTWSKDTFQVELPGYKIVTPREQVFEYTGQPDEPVLLADFRVVHHPFLLFP
jgi:hypothetical protein